jgi:hypothetical protein
MGRKDSPRENIRNENQLGLATGIDYLSRQSPLCSVVLRDHSREHLIRCQASFRMWSAILNDRNGTHFHLMGSELHLIGVFIFI